MSSWCREAKLRTMWNSLSELRSSLCERQLERTFLRPALLPVKTAPFTQFFRQVWRHTVPIPVAVRSKAKVCGRSPAEILGSNPTGGMDVCLLWVLCVVRYRSLRRADHSSRGVLTVVRRCVWSRNIKNEEAMTRVESQRHEKQKMTSHSKIAQLNLLAPEFYI
jgi:hypothetical protein